MKKVSKIMMGSLVGLCGLMLVSCGDDALSKGSAKKALQDQLVMFQDSSQVVKLSTGYYEQNNENARLALKKLAAAGMIDYKVDLIVDINKGWYSTYKENHYFVTVNLTEEGKKYIVSEPVVSIPDEDLEVEEDETEYPEDKVTPGDDLNSITPKTEPKPETASNASSSSSNSSGKSASNIRVSADASDYEKALARVNSQDYYLLSHKNKIIKIQDIFCPEELAKQGVATCTYIYECSDVTPFGRILNGTVKGTRQKATAKFIKYVDEGWKVNE